MKESRPLRVVDCDPLLAEDFFSSDVGFTFLLVVNYETNGSVNSLPRTIQRSCRWDVIP
jgi:hypothetical protein